ncbi:MAG TPA: DUF4426 domain-containing protein [Gammaproteobacteria bacterium]|nr:DUF4426 domain-containing protein [Gammaproteobacteria bacterium]
MRALIRNWCGVNLLALLLALPGGATAEQSMTFGNYTVHYNAFASDLLQAEVAKRYGISRSKGKGVLNISVLKKTDTGTVPVKAAVSATAANLSAQLRTINLREITERDSVYYIGEFAVNNEETLKFTLQVTPEGGKEPYTATFDQQFFTE